MKECRELMKRIISDPSWEKQKPRRKLWSKAIIYKGGDGPVGNPHERYIII